MLALKGSGSHWVILILLMPEHRPELLQEKKFHRRLFYLYQRRNLYVKIKRDIRHKRESLECFRSVFLTKFETMSEIRKVCMV